MIVIKLQQTSLGFVLMYAPFHSATKPHTAHALSKTTPLEDGWHICFPTLHILLILQSFPYHSHVTPSHSYSKKAQNWIKACYIKLNAHAKHSPT